MFRTNIMISCFGRPSFVQNFSIFINLSLTNRLEPTPLPLLIRRQNIKIQVRLGFCILGTVFHTPTTWHFHYYMFQRNGCNHACKAWRGLQTTEWFRKSPKFNLHHLWNISARFNMTVLTPKLGINSLTFAYHEKKNLRK